MDDYGSKELRRNRTFLTTLLRIGEDRRIPVVIVGRLSAVRLLDTIGHQADTFEVLTLPKWQDDDDFKAFLNEAESHLPLREPSHLSSLEIREPLLDASKGRLGTIDALLRACCRKAIDTRREQITPGIIEQVSGQAAKGQLEQAGSQTPEHPILDDQRY